MIGFVDDLTRPARKDTLGARISRLAGRRRDLRRGQPRVACGPGGVAGAGRAGRAVAVVGRACPVYQRAGHVRGGQRDGEADVGHRRDGRRRGRHRRSGRRALGRDDQGVRRRLRGHHVGNLVARVHPWPHPAAVDGAAQASGRARRDNPGAGGHRRTRLHRHRFAATPGIRTRQTGRLVRPYEDRGQGHPASRPVTPGRHPVHRDRSAGAGRGPAAGRTRRIRQGRGEHAHRR
jgi:hypothetical protein